MKTKQVSKLLVVVLSLVMIASLFAGLSIVASAEETASTPCVVDDCSGTYENGFCSDCGGYQACQQDGDGTYLIGNAGQLYWFAAKVNDGLGNINGKLTADIVVNTGSFDKDGNYTVDGETATPRVWTPIGTFARRYAGTFDGDQHSISGLYVNSTEVSYVGFFGKTENATIQSLTLKNSYIKGSYFVGGIVGYAKSTKNGSFIIKDCHVDAACFITASAYYAGGVAGIIYSDCDSMTFSDCTNGGAVSGNDYVGGVSGRVDAINATISGCSNSGTISGRMQIGGVIGVLQNSNTTKSDTDAGVTMSACINSGTVSGSKSRVGGVVGETCILTTGNALTIKGCYNSGSVTGPSFVGGICGYNQQGTTITNCYYQTGCTQYGIGGTTADVAGQTETLATPYAFAGQSLNIGSSLSMKYYVAAFGDDLDMSKLKVEFTFLGEVKTATATKDEDTGLYVFTLDGITPQCMGSNIKAVLKYDGEVKATMDNYSVEENLTNLLKNESLDENTKTLIGDILAYGSAAQAVTGYYSMKNTYNVRPDVTIKGEKVELEEPFTGYTVTFGYLNSIKVKWTDDNGNEKIAEYTEIQPTDFSKKYSIAVGNARLKLSVNDYLYALYNSEGVSKADKTLAQALYNYGLSAHIYKGEHDYEENTNTCEHGKVCSICGAYDDDVKEHSYEYTVDETTYTITEKCVNGCNHEASITLSAPENLVYDGNKKEAVVTETGEFKGAYVLSYWRDNEAGSSAKNVGTWNVRLGISGITENAYVDLQFTITPAEVSYTVPQAITGLTYTGQKQTLVTAGSFPEGFAEGEILYSLNEEDWSSSIPNGTDAGKYTVYYKVSLSSSNYKLAENCAESGEVKVTIKKADVQFTAPTGIDSFTYDNQNHELINGAEFDLNLGTITYTVYKDGECWGEDEFTQGAIPVADNAGTYRIDWEFIAPGNENYNGRTESGTIEVTIYKAESKITKDPVVGDSLVYDPDGVAFLTEIPTGSGGVVGYSLEKDGEYQAYDDFAKILTAGTHTIYYKVVGDYNHNDSEIKSFEVTIAKANAKDGAMTYSPYLDYKGEEWVLVKDCTGASGTYLFSWTEDGEYTSTIPTGTNAGTYTFWYKIAETENYNASKPQEITVIILAKTINYDEISNEEVTLTFSDDNFTWDGNEKKPTVTIVVNWSEDNKVTLVEGTDYDLTYSNNINVGTTATVTITFKGNYSGTITRTFTISSDTKTEEFEGTWITT